MKKNIMAVFVTLLIISTVSTVFAHQNGNEYAYNQEDGPLRDGSCKDVLYSISSTSSDIWNGGNGFGDTLHLKNGSGDCKCD